VSRSYHWLEFGSPAPSSTREYRLANGDLNGKGAGRGPKLTDAQRDEIRRRMRRFENPTVIARDFNITRGTISRIMKGES
jgi:DNA invertase Pin-like site-specific DNA recombinase